MHFIKKHMSQNEKIYVLGHVCEWIYVPAVVIFALVGIIGLVGYAGLLRIGDDTFIRICQRTEFFICGVAFCLYAVYHYYKYKCVEMAVTNERVIYKKGIIANTTAELRIEKVEGVSVKQSILGAIFGYGNIIFTGVGDTTVTFPDVKNPLQIKKEIDAILNNFKN